MDYTDDYYLNFIRETHNLKDVSKKLYENKILAIIKDIMPGSTINSLIKDPEVFNEKLKAYSLANKGRIMDTLSIHVIESYFTAIIALFIYNQKLREDNAELYQKWKTLQSKYKDSIDNNYKSNEPSDRQKLAYIPFDEIIKIRDKLPPGSIERLLIMMYTEIPPARSDYHRTKIVDTIPSDLNGDQNYIVVTNTYAVIILAKYKTSKKYGTIFIDVPEILKEEIHLSLKKQPREYLFVSSSGDPYDKENSFNKWANIQLKKILKNENFSLSMFRHIYISRRDLNLEIKSGLEQDDVAKQMGHSIAMQRGYSWHTWVNKKE